MYSNASIRGPGVPSLSFMIFSEQQNHQKWDGIRDLLGVLDIVPVWELVKQFMYGCCFAFGAGLEVSKELERRDGREVDKSKDNL